MAVVMRIDDVPDEVYRELRGQARAAGRPLGDYLRDRLGELVRPEPAPASGTTGQGVRTAANVPLQMRRRIEEENVTSARSTE